MKYYAVIDTNVLVSALITKKEGVATKKIWDYVLDGTIVPLFNSDILAEYSSVLHREHFKISADSIDALLKTLSVRGIACDATTVPFDLIDPDDTVFYAISVSRDDAYLITGNLRHFPKSSRIVSPAEMLQIINLSDNKPGMLNDPQGLEYMSEQARVLIQRCQDLVEKARQQAIANGTANMTMEEIDEEIRKARAERRLRKEMEKDSL